MEDERVPQIYTSTATTNHNCSVGIGCMSSKRKGTISKKKKLDGWFVKLMCGSKYEGPVVDPQKLQDKSTSTKSPKSEMKEKKIATKSTSSPSTNESTQLQLESFTVVIKRGPSGFGFSLDGVSPACISKVEGGSAAAAAGLQKGDYVMRYNGQNVSRLSARELKSIILRSGLPRIILDIQRGDRINGENKENKILVKPALPSHITCEMHDELSNFSGSSSYAALKRGSFLEVPTMNSAQLSEENYTYDSGEMGDNADCITEIKESTRITQDLPNEMQEHQAAIQKLLKLEKQFVQQMSLGVQQYSRPLRHCVISPKQHQAVFQNIEKLVAVSEFHVRQLNEKSATYSDVQWGGTYGGSAARSVIDTVGAIYLPRIKILSDSYLTYMQGLDAAKSLLSELKGYPEFNMFLQTSDEVYTEMSIEEFVDMPCMYLRSLHEHLKLVASNTPSHHHDHFPIHQVLHEMNTSMVRIFQIRNKLSKKHSSQASISSGSSGYSGSSGLSRTSTYSALSGISRSSGFSRASGTSKVSGCSRSSDFMGSSGLSRPSDASMESTFLSKFSGDETLARGGSSVAVDALSFQQRLSFPSTIQKSRFLPLMRHLIYCGELMWKSPDSQWTTVCAALFSEALVLTRLDTSGKLNVIREPLALNQITHLSFMSPHPSEFKVRSMVGEKSVELRAKTLEQKCVWKNLLEQRLAAVRTSSLERVQKQKILKSKMSDNRL